MKKIIKNSLFIFLLIGFISCNGKRDDTTQSNNKQEELLKLREDFEYVNLIPDSLRTPEQNTLLRLIVKTVTENMVIENKRFVFKLTREDVVNLGIPEPYYEVMVNNAIANNIFMDNATDSVSASMYKIWERDKDELRYKADSIEIDETKVKK